jgi:hypothetical protein
VVRRGGKAAVAPHRSRAAHKWWVGPERAELADVEEGEEGWRGHARIAMGLHVEEDRCHHGEEEDREER